VKAPVILAVVVVAALIPQLTSDQFTLGVFTDAMVYVSLALSYDLTVGQIGSLSLAHPAFFGIGAYTAALLVEHSSLPVPVQMVSAVAVAGLLAALIGIPSFRLSNLTFGMATLGFALIAQLVTQNEVTLTGGPLCISGLAPVSVDALTRAGISVNDQQYYLFFGLAVIVAIFIRVLTTSRIGRAYTAVREDEAMAMVAGISPTRYRMSSFIIGGAIAGAIGAAYAHYVSVVCPSNLDISYTVNLLVIVFLGGAGGFWGIIGAAVLFTAIPEGLQVDPTNRLLIYGAVLLLGVTLMPEGLERLTVRTARQVGRQLMRWRPK
jgi:ABC-type branched-subunit amino acid transport system permease subunit